jgi:AP-2 complex subunit alpha
MQHKECYVALKFPHITDTLNVLVLMLLPNFHERIVKNDKDPQKIFDAINKHFQYGGNKSKAIMLNSFVKLASKYPELKEQVEMICHLSSGHWDPDVQQRGV